MCLGYMTSKSVDQKPHMIVGWTLEGILCWNDLLLIVGYPGGEKTQVQTSLNDTLRSGINGAHITSVPCLVPSKCARSFNWARAIYWTIISSWQTHCIYAVVIYLSHRQRWRRNVGDDGDRIVFVWLKVATMRASIVLHNNFFPLETKIRTMRKKSWNGSHLYFVRKEGRVDSNFTLGLAQSHVRESNTFVLVITKLIRWTH